MEKIDFTYKVMQCGSTEYAYQFTKLDKALGIFKNHGFRVCSLEDIAHLEVISEMSEFETCLGLTREGVLCIPGSPPQAKLLRDSPLFGADNVVRINNLIYPTEVQIAKALEESMDFPVQEEESKGNPIYSQHFGSNEFTTFLFGGGDREKAREYGRAFSKSRWHSDHILVFPEVGSYINRHNAPFVKSVSYGLPSGDDFDIYLSSRELHPNPDWNQTWVVRVTERC